MRLPQLHICIIYHFRLPRFLSEKTLILAHSVPTDVQSEALQHIANLV